jgi:beta-lactamase family protein
VPAPAPTAAAEVLAAVAAAGAQARGTIEVVVLDPDGREQLASPGAGVPTWTASLSKTLVVQQLLDPDGARPPVAPSDLRLLERALSASDDSAMNALWSRFDGPALVAEAATEFGLSGTAAPADSSQWGEATTTARDYAGFMHRLRYALDDASLTTLTGWLQSTSDRAADGFDQTFGLRSGVADTGAPAAVKQGWMCCIDGRRQLHSAGSLADGRTVVLLGDFPASTSWAAAHGALDQAAQAVVSGP